jgi:UDP-glucuronate decarboxylase
MRILVTGGAGFLGSHLGDELLKMGHSVISLDNYVTGSRSNIAHNLNNPNFEAIRHDVTFPFFAEVDGIFNLACPASPVHYQKDPVQTLKTSVHGAINMLGLAKRTKARILQASTSEVYGDPEINPQVESYWGHVNPTGIRACYDEGKRAAETLFSDYHRQHKVDVRIPRIFNTYGPRMALNDGRVVSTLIIQALNNQDMTLFGDGEQTRSFCYVDDLISGLLKLFFTEGIYEPVNLGNPEPISMNQLAAEIIEITNSNSKIKYTPLPSDDPKLREPDITRAKTLLGWEPSVSRKKGLESTVRYFEEAIRKSNNS